MAAPSRTAASATGTVYAAAMVAAIVGVDRALLRHLFWDRLGANIGIVTVFAGVYLLVLRSRGTSRDRGSRPDAGTS